VDARALGAAGVGIGLRAPHCREILERRPALDFVEVHSENYFGGAAAATLERVRREYPVTLHGVGLSLGSADPLDERHLEKLAVLARRIEPAFVSEHLSWTSVGGRHANELLPLPFTKEAVIHLSDRIARTQDRLGRRLLVENVSAYHAFTPADMAEWEFVSQVVRRAGCALLLDLNNVYVNAANFGLDARAYLAAIDPASVAQYHLGGFEREEALLVDTHGARVAPGVWSLYREALDRIGPRPTLVEWDTQLPALDVLLAEAQCARDIARREELVA
jgi:uncharacterized protein (UPF0276 family)